MNNINFEGKVLYSDVAFLPEGDGISICRIILKDDMLSCLPVLCFGKMALEVKKAIKKNENICVTGKLRTYIFHDGFNTEKLVAMISAKEVIVNDQVITNVDDNGEVEESCLKTLCDYNMLPVPEAYCEMIAKELTWLCW